MRREKRRSFKNLFGPGLNNLEFRIENWTKTGPAHFMGPTVLVQFD